MTQHRQLMSIFGPGGEMEVSEEEIVHKYTSIEGGTPAHQAVPQTYRVYKTSPYGLTLPELWKHARAFGDRTFLVYEGERLTFAETFRQVRKRWSESIVREARPLTHALRRNAGRSSRGSARDRLRRAERGSGSRLDAELSRVVHRLHGRCAGWSNRRADQLAVERRGAGLWVRTLLQFANCHRALHPPSSMCCSCSSPSNCALGSLLRWALGVSCPCLAAAAA